MQSEPVTRRVYSGATDLGESFAVLFTSHGIKWVFGEEASPYVTASSGQPKPSNDPGPKQGGVAAAVAEGLDLAAGVVGAATRLVEALAAVGMWWETRQYRIMEQAQFEENRRIPWTSDMMVRWVTAHEDRQHLDLRISAYLAREAVLTMDALVENKKMAVPQSMLYDLELIREVLASSRILLRSQFEELYSDGESELASIIAGALPGSRLDMDFIVRIGEDPVEEWSRRVRERTSRNFDDDLREATRHSDVFLARLLPSTDSHPEPDDFQNRLLRFATRVNPIPLVPQAVGDFFKEGFSSRRDDFRELTLLAAEVGRATALHSAWGIVDAIVRQQIGTGILVTERHGKLELFAGNSNDGLRPLGRKGLREITPRA